MITIPAYCIHPEREGKTCRGCEESFEPALFDGGCRLSGKGGGLETLLPFLLGTVKQPRVNFRKIQRRNLIDQKKTEG